MLSSPLTVRPFLDSALFHEFWCQAYRGKLRIGRKIESEEALTRFSKLIAYLTSPIIETL